MRVFVVGATGFVGGAVTAELLSTGYEVVGLARTAAAAERLRARGVRPVRGDLEGGLAEALRAAAAAEVTVFAAQVPVGRERVVVDAFLSRLAGGGKLVFVSGTGVLMQRTEGAWSADSFSEDDPFEPEPLALDRVHTENAVRDAGSVVVRLPYLWGDGEHGHVAAVHRSVAVTGSACYVGEGLNCYSNLHVDDAARLVRAALQRGQPGGLYHGVGGEIPNRWIAESVASSLGCTTRSLTMREATEIWGEFTALIMSATSRCRAPRTRRELRWRPVHTDLLASVGARAHP